MADLIYLNNAGTTWPKPEAVHEAVQSTLRASPAGHGSLLERTSGEVARFLGIDDADRLIFTPGCTSALSLAILDLPWQAGDVVLTSHLEHHALVRAVLKLVRERGVVHEMSPYAPGRPLDLEFVREVLRGGNVRLVACTMACNVTGEILPVAELTRLARSYGALSLIDGAQTVGLLPVDLEVLGADLFTFAGHKAPMGPLGVGGLYVAPGTALECPSASCGIGNEEAAVLESMPSYCDTGSANMAAVAGLAAALRWIREQGGVAIVGERSRKLAMRLRAGLETIPGIELQGRGGNDAFTAAVSVARTARLPIAEVARQVGERGVQVGAGFHCAPLAHEALGTARTGTMRLSCGPFNTENEIDHTIELLAAL